ncbi:MAG: SPOR domain-containing protein [Methylocella sp.]|jgi:hypothetical protein
MIDLEQFERRLRQPNAAGRTDEDPLVELARLVGGPDDPYKAVFEAQADHRAAGAGETQGQYEADAWEEAEPHDFETEERMLNAGYASFEAEAPRGQSPSALHENAGAFLADDQSEHGRYEDVAATGSDYESDYESETRSRRPLYIMAAIIVAGIGGIGMSFALKGGSAPHEVAMIKAVDGPAKVQPETTAGADAPSQDASILNRIPQAAPVAVADATEQPLDLSQMPDHTSRVPAPGSGAASVAVPPSPAQGPGAAQASAEPQSIAGLIEPKKVKTVSVRPDGAVLSYDAAPPTPSVAAAPAHLGAAPAAKAATPKSTARVATTPKPVAAAGATDVARVANPNNPKPVEVADAQAGSAPASEGVANGGAFAVQLAAPSSEQEARDIQLRLIKKYGADIPGFHPSIRKAVSGDKTVYRVRTVGLSKEDATALCQKVLTTGGKCFVAKN